MSSRTGRDGNLRQLFRARLRSFHFQSIESHGTGRGTPDLNYCRSGREGWIEFKQTSGAKAVIRPEQIGWIETRIRHGGRVFIAVRQKTDDRLWLLAGLAGRHLATCRLADLPADLRLGSWPGGPPAWDWNQIELLLT